MATMPAHLTSLTRKGHHPTMTQPTLTDKHREPNKHRFSVCLQALPLSNSSAQQKRIFAGTSGR